MTPPQIPIARFKIFADGLDHPEGLALDADGRLWAGGELGQIYRLDRRGRPTEIARLGGFCLGLTFSRVQEFYVCNFKRHALIRLNRKGRVLDSWERVGIQKTLTLPIFRSSIPSAIFIFPIPATGDARDGCVYRLRPNNGSSNTSPAPSPLPMACR